MSTGQSERRLGARARLFERGIPPAEPTRRTLVFPAVEVPRSRRAAMPPPLPGPRIPRSRPSERPTLKTLPPVDDAEPGTSNTEVIELSASALDSDPSLLDLDLDLDLDRRLGFGRRRELDATLSGRFERVGGWRSRARVVRRWLGFAAIGAVGVGVFLAANLAAHAEPFGTASVVERVTGVSDGLRGAPRMPNEAASQRTRLVLRAVGHEASVPAGACAMSGASRVLAQRAHLAPGLDVNVLDGGFGVGFVTGADEALGMRLDGSPLRVIGRVRVHASSVVRHVAVDAGRSDDDGIDLRIDADGARTVVPDGEAPAFRVTAAGGWIQLVGGGLATGRTLWPVPGPRVRAAAQGVMRARTAAQGAMRTRDGFVRLGTSPASPAPARVFSARPAEPLDIRAAAREEGGAVIALRRPSVLWLGLIDGRFAAEGPLVALTRPGAVIGMPAVAPRGTGGAVAWAERPAGDRDWLVMVASFGSDGDGAGAHEPPAFRVIAAGMSPSIATLPDGDLLLAYAAGVSGSHRVVVRRLGHDLEPRGEPLVVSPEEINAGQPAAAVAADGRALVAFFGAERDRPSSVLATPLACAMGM